MVNSNRADQAGRPGVQVAEEHYIGPGYDSQRRFASYWHQLHELLALEPESILEVGKGSGFLSGYLARLKQPAWTVDIDSRLAPDVVGSALELPFRDGGFDVVACFQVLEHLPYEHFPAALAELRRVARRHVVLSLPNARRVYKLLLEVPKLGELKRLISLPCFPRKHRFKGQHYWEIGKRGYPLRDVLSRMRESGLRVCGQYRIFEHPYHHMFILGKD